jgi:hypothetical protein
MYDNGIGWEAATMANRKRKLRSATFGSISTATLIPSELFSAFLWEAQHIRLTQRERVAVRRIAADRVTEEETADERLQFDLEELTAILEDNAPAYGYFGTLDGDGADFGFWLSEDWQECFDGLTVSDTSEIPKGYTGEVLHINDHGNCTLYVATRRGLREVWAVV